MPSILDACCGGKMFWFDKDDSRVLFQDIRCTDMTLCDGRKFSVKPDVVADFTSMPYPDNSFRMVVFDPPHLKYTGSKKEAQNWQMQKYGWLPAHGWQDILRKGFAECFRVLMPGGFLIFKWNETNIRVSEILKLTPSHQASIRPYLRQTGEYSLDMFYERGYRNCCYALSCFG